MLQLTLLTPAAAEPYQAGGPSAECIASRELGKQFELDRFDAGHGALVTQERIRQTAVLLDFAARHVPGARRPERWCWLPASYPVSYRRAKTVGREEEHGARS